LELRFLRLAPACGSGTQCPEPNNFGSEIGGRFASGSVCAILSGETRMTINMRIAGLVLASVSVWAGLVCAADPPSAEIANRHVRVRMYLPDANNGYYRGTRFDWSGVVYSLQYKGHDYYGPWFNKTDPTVHDFVYEGPDIIAGPCSAITGPVDEFGPVGWDGAKPGGNFIKIGVGVLRRPDEGAYDNYRLYEIADGGKWTIAKSGDSVEFTQEVSDSISGFAYLYRKTVRLAAGRPEMVLERSLKNTGARVIQTSVYNHNFLVLDGQPPGPDFAISVPFQIQRPGPIGGGLAEIRGNQIVYLKTLEGRDVAATPVRGFGGSAKDHEIRIENSRLGAGMSIRTDRPLASEFLWSIRTVIAMEPFVAIAIDPGKEFTWKSSYRYYTLPARQGGR
jgi:hypothetical protein